MSKRPHYIALGLIVFLAILFLSLPNQAASRLKLALGSFFLPLFGLANTSKTIAEQVTGSVVPRRTLLQQLEELERENHALKFNLLQSTQIWAENEKLREAVEWKKQSPWKVKLGRVILRDPANWWRTFRIDLGTRDGVAKDLPVLTPEGLVGRVQQAGYSSSEVVLVGNPNCGVAALVQAEMPVHGAIGSGSPGWLEHSIVNLTYLDRQSLIRPGQRVITSGLGGVFPKGIPLGQIIETNSVGFGLYLEARLKLAVDLRNLEEVWVLFP